ncbi:uncharacterized protein VSU04_005502 [Chlamydotis macqueenii]
MAPVTDGSKLRRNRDFDLRRPLSTKRPSNHSGVGGQPDSAELSFSLLSRPCYSNLYTYLEEGTLCFWGFLKKKKKQITNQKKKIPKPTQTLLVTVAPRAGLPGAARDAPRQVRPHRRGRRRRGNSKGRGQGARHGPRSGQMGGCPREASITSQFGHPPCNGAM